MTEVMEDLTGDGGVKKTILRQGSGPTVTENSAVQIQYRAYEDEKPDEPFDSTFKRNSSHRSLVKTLTVRGLAIAVLSMRQGERCHVVIAPDYGFGGLGCPPMVPPQATLMYDIYLVSFQDYEHEDFYLEGLNRADIRSLNFGSVYQMCRQKFKQGIWYYTAGELSSAAWYFGLARRVMGWTIEPNNQEGRDLRNNMLTMLLENEAQCALRARDYMRAVQRSREVLSINPENARALYRCGLALHNLGFLREAADMLRRAHVLLPSSHSVKSELDRIERHLQARSSEVIVRWPPAVPPVPVSIDLSALQAHRVSTAVAARRESTAVPSRRESSDANPEYL